VTWLAVASLAAFIGQFSAELMEDSFQVLGVAEQNMLPKILSWKHPRFGTPWINILMQMCIVASLLTFDFNKIVIIGTFFSLSHFFSSFVMAYNNNNRQYVFNNVLSS
jgi:amino acid transporter